MSLFIYSMYTQAWLTVTFHCASQVNLKLVGFYIDSRRTYCNVHHIQECFVTIDVLPTYCITTCKYKFTTWALHKREERMSDATVAHIDSEPCMVPQCWILYLNVTLTLSKCFIVSQQHFTNRQPAHPKYANIAKLEIRTPGSFYWQQNYSINHLPKMYKCIVRVPWNKETVYMTSVQPNLSFLNSVYPTNIKNSKLLVLY